MKYVLRNAGELPDETLRELEIQDAERKRALDGRSEREKYLELLASYDGEAEGERRAYERSIQGIYG